MKNFTVIKDRNTGSDLLKDGFTDLNLALEFAKEQILDTNPENDSEGINIYSEEGMEITMGKSENGKGYYFTKLNPATQMPVSETTYINC
jgi:hypothetical protein